MPEKCNKIISERYSGIKLYYIYIKCYGEVKLKYKSKYEKKMVIKFQFLRNTFP